MPLGATADDYFIQEKTGINASSTSHSVSLDAGTTEGKTVLVLMNAAAVSVTGVPAGFASVGAAGQMLAYVKTNVGAGETSWGNWTFSIAGVVTWHVRELDKISVDPYDGHFAPGGSTVSNGGTKSTGTTPLNAGSWGAALAVFGTTKAGGTDVNTLAGYTNGFSELLDFAPSSGDTGRQLAVAWKPYEATATYESTATLTSSVANAVVASLMLLLRADDASINAPLSYCTGFGFGTHGGMGNGTSGPLAATGGVSGTFGTNYSVSLTAGKDGGYGLDLNASASIAWAYLPPLAVGTVAFAGNVQPVSGSGTPTALILDSTQGDVALLYDVANEKFGLQWVNAPTSGTAVWQTGTTPLGAYPWVEIRATMNASTFHAEWWIETGTGDGYQTPPDDPTGRTAVSTINPILGSLSSQTSQFYYTNVVYSRYSAAYPLTPHTVRLLTPETTGATAVGTSTNFSRFTANGTLAAVNGTEGALLDEVPPTVSASSDGVVQTAVAASDYLNLPMTTYTLAPNEIIAAVRFVASEWGGTGSGTGTLGWRGYDGLTETIFQAASALYDADSLTAISATYPRWVSAMWSGAQNGAWTQERLDNTAVRMGFSTDATPDMGASAVYLEVATRQTAAPVVAHRLTSDEDPEAVAAVVTETLHPYNSGVRTYTVSNDDPTRTAEFNYSIGGTPQTPVTVAPTDPPVDVTVGAESFGEVDSTSFGWQ